MTSTLYTVRYRCGDETRVPYADTHFMNVSGKNGEAFLSSDNCPAHAAAKAARSFSYTIEYDTPSGIDGTPVDGWYPSEAKSLDGDSDRIIDGPDGTPDWNATGRALLTRWGRINSARGGRVRLRGWDHKAGSEQPTVKIVVRFKSEQ